MKRLTPYQCTLLKAIASGLTRKEIAAQYGRGFKGMDVAIREAYARLGLRGAGIAKVTQFLLAAKLMDFDPEVKRLVGAAQESNVLPKHDLRSVRYFAISAAVERHKGNVKAACREIGMNPMTFYRYVRHGKVRYKYRRRWATREARERKGRIWKQIQTRFDTLGGNRRGVRQAIAKELRLHPATVSRYLRMNQMGPCYSTDKI